MERQADSRTPDDVGLAIATTKSGTIAIQLNDGRTKTSWDSDPDLLEPGKVHHVAVIVDAGPKIISFTIDGVLCNGGETRPHGWRRHADPVGDVSGSGTLCLAPSLHGELKRVRLYNCRLRVSLAIAHYHAGP